MDSEKVFSSSITRVESGHKNNLYDLLDIEPAKPLSNNSTRNETCNFIPKCDKHYLPKKGSKLKVKTVRDIRNLFEQDAYTYVPSELEIQQNYLLRKIRDGKTGDESTKKTASNIVIGDKPISRTAWQMLININPENHRNSKQFILWNGKCIQVNGSRGGKNKFINKYDDYKNNTKTQFKNSSIRKNVLKPRKGLLWNSLSVKFKPGPLGKKNILDDSHQKYLGCIELIKLPEPALDILPTYGNVLDPTISNFINNLRDETGLISQKWAELAVSVLGTIKDKSPLQLDNESCITFDLNYKCDQNRLLMRRDIDSTGTYARIDSISHSTINSEIESDTVLEIQKVMEDMLKSVEISLQQDCMYSLNDEPRGTTHECPTDLNVNTKDKVNRKYCELDRLNVTVIKLPEKSQINDDKPCGKSFCALGCVCDSINYPFSLKQHCGNLECMFGCKCEISKYKEIELLERDCTEIIPGILKLDKEINSNLAKEEQKFHQTVIVSGDKSILLKSHRRNWKSSKKYADFYSNMNLKTEEKIKRTLAVVDKKLNCKNIEPWCMVHNLYKCFCRGKFIESSACNATEINSVIPATIDVEKEKFEADKRKSNEQLEADKEKKYDVRNSLRPRARQERKSNDKSKNVSLSENTDTVNICSDNDEYISKCARTTRYEGRKFSDVYYQQTNTKILEMEKNDNLLKRKMLRIVNASTSESEHTASSISTAEVSNDDTATSNETTSGESIKSSSDESLRNKTKLISWLESNYKIYKERIDKGITKSSLEAPRKGKMALLPWEFILSRYRERKNLFLVSKQLPFRIFLAVDTKHAFFENCVNIDDIRFADLPNYPITIRNLLTNATDLKNNFCILGGWEQCWELIASVTKLNENDGENQSETKESFDTDELTNRNISQVNENDEWFVQDKTLRVRSESLQSNSESLHSETKCEEKKAEVQNSDSSKWFLLTVEKDFTEIQFYKRGFFVTYNSIIQSINLARVSGKTVRLSSQVCAEKNNDPQFGIYAIPNTSDYCVFIGPYEVNEPLGIETVKTLLDSVNQKKTRGVWVSTNKVDDIKVINNPLLFMPSKTTQNEVMVALDSGSNFNTSVSIPQMPTIETENNVKDKQKGSLAAEKSEKEKSKIVKPIKIRRTNGFYHLSSKNILQKIASNKGQLVFNRPSTLKKQPLLMSLLKKSYDSSNSQNNSEESNTSLTYYNKPVAEIAPQIKITSVYSERDISAQAGNADINKSSMFILKPDEINMKLLSSDKETVESNTTADEMSMDIENFLATSSICTSPNDEVLVISDGEDNDIAANLKDVWIECSNFNNFGWIRGRLNEKQLLSFEFPGFNYSGFYTQNEAFNKINHVLARKIFIPVGVKLEWRIIESKKDLTGKRLTSKLLNKRYLVTKLKDAEMKSRQSLKTYSRNKTIESASTSTGSHCENDHIKSLNELNDLLAGFEETSVSLENEGVELWNEALSRKNDIIFSLNVPESMKTNMTDTLKDIMSMNVE